MRTVHALALSASLAGALACDGVPRAELQEARAELDAARAELDAARAELQEARTELKEATERLMSSRRDALGDRRPTPGGPSPTLVPGGADVRASEESLKEAAAAAIECIDDGHCTITRAFIEQALQNPALLSRQARIVPSVRDGVSDGLRLYAIRRGSILQLLGLRNGDTLTAVNDMPLSSMDASLQAYTELRRSDRLVLQIVRKGEPMVLQIDISGESAGASPTPQRDTPE